MASCQRGNMPFPDPMLTQFYDAMFTRFLWHHWASMIRRRMRQNLLLSSYVKNKKYVIQNLWCDTRDLIWNFDSTIQPSLLNLEIRKTYDFTSIHKLPNIGNQFLSRWSSSFLKEFSDMLHITQCVKVHFCAIIMRSISSQILTTDTP